MMHVLKSPENITKQNIKKKKKENGFHEEKIVAVGAWLVGLLFLLISGEEQVCVMAAAAAGVHN